MLKKNQGNKVKKNKKKIKKKSKNTFYYLSLILLIIFLTLFFYIVYLFPFILSKKIFNDIIKVYSPLIIQDCKDFRILKLTKKPDIKLNQELYNEIYNKYGLKLKFEKVSESERKDINRLCFYKDNKIYEDLIPIYIYWDETILEDKIKENSITQKILVNENKKINLIKEKDLEDIKKEEKIKEKNEIKNFKTNYRKLDNNFDIKESNIKIIKKEKPQNIYRIAIIIDDVGYNYSNTYNFLNLNVPLTFAIIPDMSLSKKFYYLIKKYNYESILHIPMEPKKGKDYVEKNAILTEMSDEVIKNRIKKFINDYPLIIGANNHMGSKIVKDSRIMKIIFEELAKNNKLWVDSMTSYSTISEEIAKKYKIEYYKRDFFLDNEKDINSIRKSFELLIQKAKKNGYAIGIGHIQSYNLPVIIKEYYDKKDELNIEFVFLSQLRS